MATFLLELFSEEIPSRMQRQAAEQLERLLVAGLAKNGFSAQGVKTYVSPRHLGFSCDNLPVVQPDVREERKGPKVGAPEQALKGFLGATGLTLEQCEQRDGYYFASIERKGRPAAEVLKTIVEEALQQFSWPKSMRWGARPLAWVRPLHRMVCLLDDVVVPVSFAHIVAGNVTHGHRFMAPDALVIPHAERYEALLEAAFVQVDYAARRAKIAAGISALADAAKLTLVQDDALLDEVTGLVEWPVPLIGEFDAKFLGLPPEVLISEMKVHQRYFALCDGAGALSNRFIAVANMVTEDGGARIIAGNGRVLRARLSDGEFYWEQDRKRSLADWAGGLKDVVFHAKVGMMDAKVQRIEALALRIAADVDFADRAAVARAAQLCKADLTSGMVGEFPELQGIMGRYYAAAQNENAAVADAIRDHYKPLGAGDTVPDAALAAIVAVADKLDSIVSLFAAGEKPTGSKDPLALRRAALGVLRILLQHGWQLDLAAYCGAEVVEFFRERLKQVLRDDGVPVHCIEAGLKAGGGRFVPAQLGVQVKALYRWSQTEKGRESIAAIKRVLNILAAEEKKDKAAAAADAALIATLTLPAERQLADALAQAGDASLAMLEGLSAPIGQFFTDVLVTEPAFKQARLALLAAVRAQALRVADFAALEG